MNCPLKSTLLTSSSWSAICRGAVIHGMTKKKLGSQLRVEVASRIARQSYGVVGEEPYDEEMHHQEDRWFDPILRKDVAIKVMWWHVKQVSSNKLSTEHVHLLTDVSTGDRATASKTSNRSESSSPDFLTKFHPRYLPKSSPTYTSLSPTNPLNAKTSPSRRPLQLHGTSQAIGIPSKLLKTNWGSASRNWSSPSRWSAVPELLLSLSTIAAANRPPRMSLSSSMIEGLRECGYLIWAMGFHFFFWRHSFVRNSFLWWCNIFWEASCSRALKGNQPWDCFFPGLELLLVS